MNKSIQLVLASVLTLSIATLFYLQFNESSKIVYVDSSKLLSQYQGMIDARAVYKQKAGTWQANIDTLTNEVKKSIQKYEKESAGMSAREKAG